MDYLQDSYKNNVAISRDVPLTRNRFLLDGDLYSVKNGTGPKTYWLRDHLSLLESPITEEAWQKAYRLWRQAKKLAENIVAKGKGNLRELGITDEADLLTKLKFSELERLAGVV